MTKFIRPKSRQTTLQRLQRQSTIRTTTKMQNIKGCAVAQALC